MDHPMVSIIIPAFDEEGTIRNVISETIETMIDHSMPYEIIVVDDGSSDNTAKFANQYDVRVLVNDGNQGKGYSLRRGFIEARGSFIVTMDSDGAHDPGEIPALVEPLFNGADVVAGSRFLGNGERFTTKINQIGNLLINVSILLLTGRNITDSQTGFRAFKRSFLDEIDLVSSGFEIESELTMKALKNGFQLKEIPIFCQARKYDISRVRILRDGIRIFKTVLSASL
jgi:glycosyltransferase involved in cell wall biosynthesis